MKEIHLHHGNGSKHCFFRIEDTNVRQLFIDYFKTLNYRITEDTHGDFKCVPNISNGQVEHFIKLFQLEGYRIKNW